MLPKLLFAQGNICHYCNKRILSTRIVKNNRTIIEENHEEIKWVDNCGEIHTVSRGTVEHLTTHKLDKTAVVAACRKCNELRGSPRIKPRKKKPLCQTCNKNFVKHNSDRDCKECRTMKQNKMKRVFVHTQNDKVAEIVMVTEQFYETVTGDIFWTTHRAFEAVKSFCDEDPNFNELIASGDYWRIDDFSGEYRHKLSEKYPSIPSRELSTALYVLENNFKEIQ